MKKRFFAFVLAASLLFGLLAPAAAEDVFAIDVDALDPSRLNSDDYVAQKLSASTQGVRVRKHISDSSELAAPVRLTLTQMDSGTITFDRDYGFQSNTFDSGVIYLPYAGDRTVPYLITLYAGDYVYALPFMHLQPRLEQNGASTCGVRLRDLDPALGGDWLMGTMVDLTRLRQQGSRTVDVIASNNYIVGQATLQMNGSSLRVDLSFSHSANVDVNRISLYVITDCAAYAAGQRFPACNVGQWVDVGNAGTALIYLPMQLSYNPSGLPTFSYQLNDSELQRQLQLWQDATGTGSPSVSSGWDDGWTDGWSENTGWDDGWNQSGDGWLDEGGW